MERQLYSSHMRIPIIMKYLLLFQWLIVFNFNLNIIYAQSSPPDLPLSITQITLKPDGVSSEQQRTLQIEVQLKPGFKAYVDKFGINIIEPYPIKHTKLDISPVHSFYDKFSKAHKLGIKDKALIKSTIEIQRPLENGAQKFKLELKFQACSESVCYFPQTLSKEFEFNIVNNKSLPQEIKSNNLLEENFLSAQKRGLPYLFFFVFLAGVLTSLTPCLLPMLPLTVAVIGKGHSHDKKIRKFLNAVTYVLGMAVTYSFLGLIAASSGALFGNILSNLWTQLVFGSAFILMGLAQFGLFELQTPLWLQNRFNKLGHKSSGIFISGLISGLIASPCVGPVLVGILTFIAQTQDHILGFWLMFAYALGLGQLLIILGVFSGLLYHFPRSPWIMKTSKIVLGFTLIASGLFYLSLMWPKKNGIFSGPVPISQSTSLLPWEVYSQELLEKSKASGRPVIIDFFADWCLACHELDEKTFSDPEIQKSLTQFTLIRFDATQDSEILNKLRAQYSIVGLPSVIFYNSKGEWLKDKTLNEFETPEKFKERLNQIHSPKATPTD